MSILTASILRVSILRVSKLGPVLATAWILAGCATADLAGLTPLDPKMLDTDQNAALPVTTARLAKTPPSVAPAAVAAITTPPPITDASREERITQALKQLEAGDPLAAERLLRSVATGSQDWRVYSGLGVAASTLGRQAEAQSHLKKALQVSPDNQTVLNNLAVSYMLDRKPSEAEVVLKKVGATGKASRETLDNLALARALKMQISVQD